MTRVSDKTRGVVMFLDLTGDFDVFAVPDFDARVNALQSEGSHRIVLRMEQVRFISSGAIGAMVRVRRQCQRSGGDMVIAGASTAVSEALSSVGLDNLFAMYADDEGACAAIG